MQWPAAAVAPPAPPSGDARSLVLYDDSGEFSALSEVYATMATSLASHFGTPTMQGVSAYSAGQLAEHQGAVYLGTNAEQTLPPAFVVDVRAGDTPVLWLGANLDQLAPRSGGLDRAYGWTWVPSELRPAHRIEYKGTELTRSRGEGVPLSGISVTDPDRAQVLATTRFDDGSTAPWAVRSGNLTYVTEVALDAVGNSGDRYLAVCDLLFDLLEPDAETRHRALVRIQDVNPTSDPGTLRRLADTLHAAGIPFSFALYPVAVDPRESEPRRRVTLSDRPAVVDAVAHMLRRGGTIVLHGYSHQFEGLANPDTGASGADFEFFRVHREPDGTLVYGGPVPGDSTAWATERLRAAVDEVTRAGLPEPRIFQFPHDGASAADYEAARQLFDARYDRPLYLSTAWRSGPMSPYLFPQYVPYVVRDGYGSTLVPENLGNVDGPVVPAEGPGSVQAILDGARQHLVVRDGVASFHFHPYLELDALTRAVDGIRDLGYEFVSPGQL
ncbi:DUF2334 domain-containing protein [Geodermatophilus sp. SYSU D01105]